MNLLPSFSFSGASLWWTSLFFLLGNLTLLLIFPQFRQRVLVRTPARPGSERLSMIGGAVLFHVQQWLPLFLLPDYSSVFFIFGLVMYLLCMTMYFWALVNMVQNTGEKPVQSGRWCPGPYVPELPNFNPRTTSASPGPAFFYQSGAFSSGTIWTCLCSVHGAHPPLLL